MTSATSAVTNVKKIRVLVVDDSVVVRRLIASGLARDPGIEVCGTAANGALALKLLPQCSPDLVTLDVEMPEMDGLATVKEIRKAYPRLPVIMFSAVTERGAASTLEALRLGASDYVTKPSNRGSLGVAAIEADLLPKVRALCRVPDQAKTQNAAFAPNGRSALASRAASRPQPQPVEILAIGSSTGGPNALADIVPHLPRDLRVPIVIVQHMPPLFTKMLAERLQSAGPFKAVEAANGMKLQPRTIYVAPGGFHMTLRRRGTSIEVALNQDPPENSCRPAVDVLFRSVAEVYGASTLAVVLTGMGSDGLRGCENIHRAGGQILTQDEATSVVWGMPGVVAKAGLSDRTLPLDQIAMEIRRRVERTAQRAS